MTREDKSEPSKSYSSINQPTKAPSKTQINLDIQKKKTKKRTKLTKSDKRVVFIILLLMFIYRASTSALIQTYAAVIISFSDDPRFNPNWIYIPDSLSVLISAFAMVIWGYYTDRIDRNKVINGGAILSVLGFLFCAFTKNFYQLLFGRVLSAMGMGFAIPIGISILMDVVPSEERSGWFGFLALFSSLSNGIGQWMGAFLTPLNIIQIQYGWQFPFIVLAGFSILAAFMLVFIKLPERGSKEKSLAEIQAIDELKYGYQINKRQLFKLFRKPSNKYLILNGFFSIIPGTILIYTLATSLNDANYGMLRDLDVSIRFQTSAILAALVAVGYFVGNISLSYLGDKLNRINNRNRSMMALISNILAIPLCLFMISQLIPVDNVLLGEPTTYLDALISIFRIYPEYITFFVFSFAGSFFSAGFVSNKNAVMVDVNLPEHRGTASSVYMLTEEISKSLTLMLVSGILILVNNNYKLMLSIGILFWIPSAYLWFLTVRSVGKDMSEKAMILRERTQLSFIDFFFELEIAIDDGIQGIQDAKDKLIRRPKKAEKLISNSINKFKLIIEKARFKELADIENRAQNLLNNALIFKSDLLMLSSNPKREDLQGLYKKIDSIWEESDFGKIEVLFESAYLRVVEARLRRSYNPVECSRILDEAIEIYERVISLTSDRIVDEDVKYMTSNEETFQERIINLLVLAQKSKSNTELLKTKLDFIVKSILNKNISYKDLMSMMEITSEYGIKLHEVVVDTFDDEVVEEIDQRMEELDQLFQAYDEWMTNE